MNQLPHWYGQHAVPRRHALSRRVANQVIEEVSTRHGVDPFEVIGRRRFADLIRARMEVCRILTAQKYSTTQIARALNKDHTMVGYYLGRSLKKKCKVNPELPPRPPKIAWSAPVIRNITPPPKPRKPIRYRIPYAGAETLVPYERSTP